MPPPQAPRPPAPPASALKLTLPFAAQDPALSGAETATLAQFAQAASPATSRFTVLAFAAGEASNPSTARRLSLSRALAVRRVLLKSGVADTHIILRALGSNTGDGSPDRVEITALPVSSAASQTRSGPAK